MSSYIDVIVPREKGLVAKVQEFSNVRNWSSRGIVPFMLIKLKFKNGKKFNCER